MEKLRLPTIRREWEGAAARGASDGRDYGDFLPQRTELIEREQRAAQRRLKSARFPVLKTLDDFDFGARNPINESLIRQLTVGEDLDARENVLMIGNSGPGKTHLATCFAACAQGKGVRFRSASALGTHMLEMREQRELRPFFAQVEKHDLILLDELGYVPFPKAGAEPLFEVVSRGLRATQPDRDDQPALRAVDGGPWEASGSPGRCSTA